jgi:hypothetical protein
VCASYRCTVLVLCFLSVREPPTTIDLFSSVSSVPLCFRDFGRSTITVSRLTADCFTPDGLMLAGWGSLANCQLLLLRPLDLKVVVHREHSGDAIGADERAVLVSLVADHAFEIDMAVTHDDANGRQRIHGVA